MATIFPVPGNVLSSPVDFTWLDYRTIGTLQPNAPNVYITGLSGPAVEALVGGEQFALSRGSTLQVNVTVTVAAPGGPTKTLAELIADINAVFGIAGGKPTDFAYEWNGGVRLVDATVGPNTGLAEVVSYAGADEDAKNALFQAVGLPVMLRDQNAAARLTRSCGLEVALDDQSAVSSNYLALTADMRSVYVEVFAGSPGGQHAPPPIVALAFSDGSAAYEPPLPYLSSYQGPEALVDPVPVFGAALKLGGQFGGVIGYVVPVTDTAIFKTSGPPITVPDVQSRAAFRVDIPRTGATRMRVMALGGLGRSSRYAPYVQARAWGVG